jgi:hypothetical protein
MKLFTTRNISGIFLFIQSVSGFVFGSNLLAYKKHHSPVVLQMSIKNNTLLPKNFNESKVFKMDFSEENDYENLFKPKYMFGLSEYNMILIRLYVYIVITLHMMTLYADKIKK